MEPNQLEIDYQTSGLRSFFMAVNGGTPTELDLNGDTFNDPTPVVMPVTLHAGSNTIEFGNATGYAPDLDRIVIAPMILNDKLISIITFASEAAIQDVLSTTRTFLSPSLGPDV